VRKFLVASAVVVFVALAATSYSELPEVQDDGIVGAWTLTQIRIAEPDGQIKDEYPDRSSWIFTQDGYYSALRKAAEDDPEHTLYANAGRYSIEGDKLTYHYDLALYSAIIDVSHEYRFSISGDVMITTRSGEDGWTDTRTFNRKTAW